MKPSGTHCVNVHLADVWENSDRTGYIRTLGWGDYIEVAQQNGAFDITNDYVRVKTVKFTRNAQTGEVSADEIWGYIAPRSGGLSARDTVVPVANNAVLKVNFVDVQQGDGAVIETPDGQIVLIDGGDNQLFARYLANRFRGTTQADPLEVDCILVTHGDADHFAGLAKILDSETNPSQRKRLFISPARVFHNGLVKRPSKRGDGSSRPDLELLGATVTDNNQPYITGLVDDLETVPQSELNRPFKDWIGALKTYNGRRGAASPIEYGRLEMGSKAFGFLESNGAANGRASLRCEVLGPLVEDVAAQNNGRGLKFLRQPPRVPGGRRGSWSASHTINGHSVILKLTYGRVNFLFAGDLNEEAEQELTQKHAAQLQAEVFKVPHHGSADFSRPFLNAVAPIVSVISCGDESARKEYIHPRANLLAALGGASRTQQPLIFITELVAFFSLVGYSLPLRPNSPDGTPVGAKEPFFAFQRDVYGLVKIRTDGRQMLIYTDSANLNMKEAYAFAFDEGRGEWVSTAINRL